MIELTRIYTVEITGIVCIKDEDDILPEEEGIKYISRDIKEAVGADTVVVTNIQDFIMEKKR